MKTYLQQCTYYLYLIFIQFVDNKNKTKHSKYFNFPEIFRVPSTFIDCYGFAIPDLLCYHWLLNYIATWKFCFFFNSYTGYGYACPLLIFGIPKNNVVPISASVSNRYRSSQTVTYYEMSELLHIWITGRQS